MLRASLANLARSTICKIQNKMLQQADKEVDWERVYCIIKKEAGCTFNHDSVL